MDQLETRLKVSYAYWGTQDGFHYEVEAQTESGRRFHLCQILDNDQVAERLVKKILEVGSIDLQYWTEGYPVYGSGAFVAEERQAYAWSQSIRAGHCSEEQVPDSLRTLL